MWEFGLGMSVCCLLFYHCWLPLPAFYSYGDKPYPALPKGMAFLAEAVKEKKPQRVASMAPWRSICPGYVFGMTLSFPTVYKVPALGGYDPAVEVSPETSRVAERLNTARLDTFRAYGVRWMLVHRLAMHPKLGPNNHLWNFESCKDTDAVPALVKIASKTTTIGDVTVIEFGDVSPMAFQTSDPSQPLPVELNGRGARVDVSHLAGGEVTVNVMKRPWMVAHADGRRLQTRADAWDRVVVDVPEGAHRLEVTYAPPWGKGFIFGIVLAAIGIGSSRLLGRWERCI